MASSPHSPQYHYFFKDILLVFLLVFQPAHAPELHPIERFWKHLKSAFAWQNYQDLDQLRKALTHELQKLESQTIASLTGWDYILDALSVAGIS